MWDFSTREKASTESSQSTTHRNKESWKTENGCPQALTGGVLAQRAAEQGVTQGSKGTVPALLSCPAPGLAVLRAGAAAVLAAQSPGGHRQKAQPHRHVEVPQVTPAE